MVHCDGKKCEKWPCEGIIAVSGWSAYVPLRLRLVLGVVAKLPSQFYVAIVAKGRLYFGPSQRKHTGT